MRKEALERLREVGDATLADAQAVFAGATYEEPRRCRGEQEKVARALAAEGLLEEDPLCPGVFRHSEKGDALWRRMKQSRTRRP